MRSPISKVGYMDEEGMNRGSATNHLKRRDTAKAAMMVFPSSEVKLIHLGNQLDFSSSSVSSTVVIESTNSEDMNLEAPLSAITVSSSCTWFLQEMAVPLDQED